MKKMRKHGLVVVISVLMGLMLLVGYTATVEAVLTPQEMSGTVEFALSSDQPWNPLTMGTTLQAGNLIRTGMDGKTTLGLDDGSTLTFTSNTQLAVVELTFSKSQKTRMYRFDLVQGTVTANVTELDFEEQNNVFEIRTDIVIASAKGTEMQVTYDVTLPQCNVFNLGGTVFFQQIAAGVSTFSALFPEEEGDDGQREGLTFPVNSMGAEILINVIVDEHTIIVQGNVPLEQVIAMLGNYIAMQVTNLDDTGQAPITVIMPDGKNKAELVEEGDKALVATDPANLIPVMAPSYMYAKFKFFKAFGTNGFIWIWCDCGAFFEEGRPRPGPVPTIPPVRTPPTGSPVKP